LSGEEDAVPVVRAVPEEDAVVGVYVVLFVRARRVRVLRLLALSRTFRGRAGAAALGRHFPGRCSSAPLS
jgi:hypothetical protein